MRLESARTGSHILDVYLENAEHGNRTLADILADLWNPSTGALRSDQWQFRIQPSGQLQFRIGDFVDPNAGWLTVTDGFIFRTRGAHTNGATYARLDVVTHAGETFVCTVAHTATTAAPNLSNFQLALGIPPASGVAFTPTGDIAATNVQSALAELDTEKVPTTRTISTGTGLAGGGNLTANRTLTFDTTWGDARYRLQSTSITWTEITGRPATFPPDTHTHTAVQISDSTAAGRTLLTAADAPAQRTALGLGTAATQASTAFQPADAELTAIAGLTSAADTLPYFTGSGTATLATFTNFARTLLDDADAAAARTTLGLVIGTNVQAQDAELAAIAGLVSAADRLPFFTGAGTAALATFTAFGRSLVDDADAAAARTTLGAQAADATLTALANLTTAADQIIISTGADAFSMAACTAFARTILDDADAATVRATISAVGQTAATGAADIPSGTDAQRPPHLAGRIRFNTTSGQFEGSNGTSWVPVGGGGAFRGNSGLIGLAASGDIIRVHAKTLTTNTTIAANENAVAAGPLTINTGVTLTVASGGRLVVV